MPGQQLSTNGIIIGRKPSGSEAFDQLTVFSEEDGQLLCLRRLSTKAVSATTPLDLFDEAEFMLESSNQGRTWFIKEHRHVARHPGIGRSYAALQTAAHLARLIQRNPVPDDSRSPVTALLRQTLASLEEGARPDLVWFKALFCFLRDEGYPVKQQWWAELTATERDEAATLLNQPVAGQNPAAETVARLTQRLMDWVAANTEIKFG
ncbi:MAG: hypothetical protein Q8J74_12670 [Candidatus Didemnitutus sp.]|nr:hypothetical protein [Candidatus Didemnitutus sp.]